MIAFVILTTLFVVVGFPLIISYGLYPDETSKQIKDFFNIGPKYDIEDEMNLFTDAEWVKKVILSCNSTTQIWKAYKLSEFLRKKYDKKVNRNVIWMVSDDICKTFDTHHSKLIYSRK